MLRTEVYDKEEKKKAIIISISEYNNNHLGSLDFCRKNGQEMHKLSKWAGSDSNQRPPMSRRYLNQARPPALCI